MIELTAGKDDNDRRLDRILRKTLPDLSLSLIHRLLRQKKILVDDKPVTLPNHRIEQGMTIKVYTPATHAHEQVNKTIVNHINTKVNNKNTRLKTPNHLADLPPILWQASGIIVFNKPQGLSTHGPNSLDSIVNDWLAAGGAGPLPRSLSFKPGPLHRLDKPTSGAIAFSQTLEGARLFSALLRDKKLEKSYIAIVEGCIEKEKGSGVGGRESGNIEYGEIIWQDSLAHDKDTHKSLVKTDSLLPTPQGDFVAPLLPIKQALTTVKTLATNKEYSLIEARIKTGRHHQIRAQACFHGHPLAGDIKYGAKPLPGQSRGGCFFLHAWKIKFTECPDGLPQEITAPLPEAFQSQIEALFGEQITIPPCLFQGRF